MPVKRAESAPEPKRYYHDGTKIPLAVIRRYARKIAERFKPEKIVLFGSHAYGTPHKDSDVDLMVVMPARDQLDQAYKIRATVPAPFAMDLVVRSPKNWHWRLSEGESFSREIMQNGKVLYERDNKRVGAQSRKRLPASRKEHGRRNPVLR